MQSTSSINIDYNETNGANNLEITTVKTITKTVVETETVTTSITLPVRFPAIPGERLEEPQKGRNIIAQGAGALEGRLSPGLGAGIAVRFPKTEESCIPIFKKGMKPNEIHDVTVIVDKSANEFAIQKLYRVRRIEFGDGVRDLQVAAFPGTVTQVKLLKGASSSAVVALTLNISHVIIDEATNKKVIEKLQKVNQNICIAVAIKNKAGAYATVRAHSRSVQYVELDEHTSVEAAASLSDHKIKGVLLGRKVSTDVVKAIPEEIKYVEIGFHVPLEAAEAVSPAKDLSVMPGVDGSRYAHLLRQHTEEAKPDAIQNALEEGAIKGLELLQERLLKIRRQEEEDAAKSLEIFKTEIVINVGSDD